MCGGRVTIRGEDGVIIGGEGGGYNLWVGLQSGVCGYNPGVCTTTAVDIALKKKRVKFIHRCVVS